jgi:hypothetical protein
MTSPARSRPQLVETQEVKTPALEDGLSELLENARLLARHAVEAGRLPEAADIERLYKIKKRFAEAQAIAEDDFGFLVKTYQLLERRLAPVSADTLRATEWSAEMPCAASKYVGGLWWRSLTNIVAILGCHLFLHWLGLRLDAERSPSQNLLAFMAAYLIPFLYGALGADAFLIRETTHKLHLREFNPRRIPENRARFLLGTLSGGVIVLFVSPQAVASLVNASSNSPDIASAALGFVAGYSNDFLFSLLERLTGALLARHTAGARAEMGGTPFDVELLDRCRRALDEIALGDPNRRVLERMVQDLESAVRARAA